MTVMVRDGDVSCLIMSRASQQQQYTTLSYTQSFHPFTLSASHASQTLLPTFSKQIPLHAPMMLHIHHHKENQRHLFSIISLLGIHFDSKVKDITIGMMHGILIFLGRDIHPAEIPQFYALIYSQHCTNTLLKFHVQFDSQLRCAPVLNKGARLFVQCVVMRKGANGGIAESGAETTLKSSDLKQALKHMKSQFEQNWHSNIIVRSAYYMLPPSALGQHSSHAYMLVKIVDWDDEEFRRSKFVRVWSGRVVFQWLQDEEIEWSEDLVAQQQQDDGAASIDKREEQNNGDEIHTEIVATTIDEESPTTEAVHQDPTPHESSTSVSNPSSRKRKTIKQVAIVNAFIKTNTVHELQEMLKKHVRGVVVYGTSGVGKTYSCRRLIKELGYSFIYLSLSSVPHDTLVHTMSELAKILIDTQHKATTSPEEKPTMVFIDDLHVLRESPAALSVLCNTMDQVNRNVTFLGSVQKISQVPDLLRRHGRYDHEIQFLPPSVDERERILFEFYEASIERSELDSQQEFLPHSRAVMQNDFEIVAAKTAGFIVSDLISLHREAQFLYQRLCDESPETTPSFAPEHYIKVLEASIVRPSLQKEETNVINVIDEVKDVKWEDIGGLEEVKQKLRQCAEWPVKYKAQFAQLGLNAPRGILMYGPPGCGKTSLVKALARSTKSAFLSLNSAAVYSPYFGDAEKTIREVFKKARLASPSIIFFDEIDAMVGNRSSSGSSSGVEQRVLSTILNEMDGIEYTRDVLVVAATNRPDMIDAALMRPGRLDYVLYVPPPDFDSRLQALQVHCKQLPLSEDISLESLAFTTDGYTGADLESVCREAAMNSLRHNINSDKIEWKDFEDAIRKVVPSVTEHMLDQYREFQEKSIK